MDQRSRAIVASVGIVAIFLVVQVGALALVEPFKDAGYQPVEDPDDPANSLVYVAAVLVITAILLAAVKLDFDRVLRGFIVFAGAYISLYVFQIGVPAVDGLPSVAGFHLHDIAGHQLLGRQAPARAVANDRGHRREHPADGPQCLFRLAFLDETQHRVDHHHRQDHAGIRPVPQQRGNHRRAQQHIDQHVVELQQEPFEGAVARRFRQLIGPVFGQP